MSNICPSLFVSTVFVVDNARVERLGGSEEERNTSAAVSMRRRGGEAAWRLLAGLWLCWLPWRGAHVRADRCERLVLPLCQDIGYNLTAMPNLMGQDDQIHADRAMQAYLPLVHYNCSSQLRLFLCSLFAPLCTEQLLGPVPPCRSLCDQVQADCQPVTESLELPWPALLNCSRLPDDAALCVGPPRDDEVPAPRWGPAQCPPDFARARGTLASAATCSPRCGRDAYYRADDKRFAQRWMLGWAWLCFLSTLFSLLTFCVEPRRFRYPERPVVFLALSYNLLSLSHIVRGALGAEAISCVSPSDGGAPYVAVDGLESGACTLAFLALYYFTTASGAWWCVLAACWYLSAAKKWSCEALHAVAPYLHLAAWLGPALLGVAALALHRVAGDELTGLCQVAEDAAVPLLVVPQGALLALGAAFAALAAASLVQVRQTMRAAGRSTEKLERLMTRLGVFAALYVLPAAGSLACLLYEAWHRPRWRSLALLAALDCRVEPGCAPGPSYRAAGVEVALLRLFLSLVVGVTSGMWVWSGKTCRAWSRLFAAPRKQRIPPATLHASQV
ncbi:frizzled-10-like [Bacillus rossius redtenbacheri]|uniref:frizzled-10-like n=1 Tax=Bacillus rossius redtenbacheri TaxID=93214 RepID=UPI002FDD7198